FALAYGLAHQEKDYRLPNLDDPRRAGFAEVVIPPRSEMVGRTIRQFSLRKRYAVEPVMMFSKGEEVRGDFSDREIFPGDTIIVYGLWEKLRDLKQSADFVVATPFAVEKKQSSAKSWVAAVCFLCAIGLAMTGAPISLAFFTGAIAMVLARALTIQEAYQAIEWKVVFLLAGLIPLGVAMQKTGTAAFLAEKVMSLVQGGHPALILLTVGVLSTLFSLFLSNVGAIVVLAPLVMSMAQIGGLDPRPLALMAAVCAANSFILPTHQVNAFLMSSGGYRNADYLKAGGGMTILFLAVVVPVFYFFYL
ncbi:MAG: anion permease, partial [Thioalkalivibrio sp.]|nr:anion permease [Thioalkalivibrio sp.]